MLCMPHDAPLFGRVWCSSTEDLYHARVYFSFFFFIIILRLFLFFDYASSPFGSETSSESSFRRTEIACTAIPRVPSLLMLLLLCLIVILFYLSYCYLFPLFVINVGNSTMTQANSCENTYIKSPFNIGTYMHVLN